MEQIILTSLALAVSFTTLPSVEGQICKFAAVARKLLTLSAFKESRFSWAPCSVHQTQSVSIPLVVILGLVWLHLRLELLPFPKLFWRVYEYMYNIMLHVLLHIRNFSTS